MCLCQLSTVELGKSLEDRFRTPMGYHDAMHWKAPFMTLACLPLLTGHRFLLERSQCSLTSEMPRWVSIWSLQKIIVLLA